MRQKLFNPTGIFSTVGLLWMSEVTFSLSTEKPLTEKCSELSAAASGLNYHRRDRDSLTGGEIWR